MSAPVIYPVYFANDDPLVTAKITEFMNGIGTFTVGSETYWSAVTAEYGVGPLTAGAPIQVTDVIPSAIDDASIQSWLAAKFNTDDPAFPVPDANTLIVLYFPANVTITLQGSASCSTFGGYHQEIQLDAAHQNQTVAYAVLPRCGTDPFDPNTGVTGAASHEIIEAATDPTPNLDPAYATVDDLHRAWGRVLGGGETADLCAQDPNSFVKFPGFDFAVQRSWSNVAAAASHDPCVPVTATSGSYFNSVPVLDDLTVTGQGGNMFTVKAVQIPVGTSKDIDVQLFSDGPTSGPWTIEAHDSAEFLGGTSVLSFAFDKTSGQNGDVIKMTVTMTGTPQRSTESFLLVSRLGGEVNFWVGSIAK